MDFRNELVKKYFIKDFNNENELYESSMKYRMECIENNIPDDVNIVKYFNTYEIVSIFTLINSNNQTEKYKTWFNKVFYNDRFILLDNKKSCCKCFEFMFDIINEAPFIALINVIACSFYTFFSLWGCLSIHMILCIVALIFISYND